MCLPVTNNIVLTRHTVYTRHMIEKRDCWVCEKCEFAWVVKDINNPPSHCASNKCHSRAWNGEDDPFAPITPEPVEPKPVKSVQPSPELMKSLEILCNLKPGPKVQSPPKVETFEEQSRYVHDPLECQERNCKKCKALK